MKCPICGEELKGTESCCPLCAWDLHRRASVFPLVALALVIFGIGVFVGIRFTRTIREEVGRGMSTRNDMAIQGVVSTTNAPPSDNAISNTNASADSSVGISAKVSFPIDQAITNAPEAKVGG